MGAKSARSSSKNLSLVFLGGKRNRGKPGVVLEFALVNNSRKSIFLDEHYRYDIKWDMKLDEPGRVAVPNGGRITPVHPFGMRNFKLLDGGYKEVVVPILCKCPDEAGVLKGNAVFEVRFIERGSGRESSEKLRTTFEMKIPQSSAGQSTP